MSTIWLVRAYTPPPSSPGAGSERHYRFAQALIRRGHDVVLITSAIARWEGRPGTDLSADDYRDEIADELTVRVLRGRPYANVFQRFLSMIHFELMVLRNTGGLAPPDLVMGTSVDPFAAHAGQLLAGRHGVPFVLELGDIWPRTLVDMGAINRWHPGYWVLRILELSLYKKAVRILSKLPFAKLHVAASRRDPAKVVYLPNGVDLSRYTPGEYPPAPEGGDGFVAAYTGGMTPIYGLENLLEAASIVARERPDLPITFRLVGSGSSRPDLENQIERRRLGNVELLDPVPRSEIPSVLAASDVCIALARDIGVVREFGMSHNKVYEYLGASRPIIFSVASANDPVAEAGAGISVTPEDPAAIAQAVIDLCLMTRQERIDMGRRGQEFVRNGYTMDSISERFARVLDEVLAGLPPGTHVSVDDLTG